MTKFLVLFELNSNTETWNTENPSNLLKEQLNNGEILMDEVFEISGKGEIKVVELNG